MSNPDFVSTPSRVGTLYVVATPIGNPIDISARAAMTLRQVAIVAAEDTRRCRVLLAEVGAVPRRLLSLGEHNEAPQTELVLGLLLGGEDVALVSDAGTPLVSDPGYPLVRAAHERAIPLIPIPGASAVMAALSVSPVPAERFLFEGFLPSKPTQRRKRLAELADTEVTVVCFEATRRLLDTLRDVSVAIGPTRPIFLAKELTKTHERLLWGTADSIAAAIVADPEIALGECVLVIGRAPARDGLTTEGKKLVRALCAELSPTQSARIAAKVLAVAKSVVYDYALEQAGRAQ